MLLCYNSGQKAAKLWEWQACRDKCCQVPHSLDMSYMCMLVIEMSTSCPGTLRGEEGGAALSMQHFVAARFFFHDFFYGKF